MALAENIDGLIISNTTLARGGVAGSKYADEAGGVGAPLFDASTDMLRRLPRRLSVQWWQADSVVGVSSAAEAYASNAGASLVQLYTGLVYGRTGNPHGAIWRACALTDLPILKKPLEVM